PGTFAAASRFLFNRRRCGMHKLAVLVFPLAFGVSTAMAQQAATGGAPGTTAAVPGAPGSATTGVNGTITGSKPPTTISGTMPNTTLPNTPNGMAQNPNNTQPTQTQAPRQLSRNQRLQQQNGVNGSGATVPDLSVTPNGTTGGPLPNGAT